MGGEIQSQVLELHFLRVFRNPLQQKSREKKKVMSSQLLWSFASAPASPHFLPSHQGPGLLSAVAMTCRTGYTFFFKIKVLFPRGAQSPHCQEQARASLGLKDLPEGNKRQWLLIHKSPWWPQPPGLCSPGALGHCRAVLSPRTTVPALPVPLSPWGEGGGESLWSPGWHREGGVPLCRLICLFACCLFVCLFTDARRAEPGSSPPLTQLAGHSAHPPRRGEASLISLVPSLLVPTLPSSCKTDVVCLWSPIGLSRAALPVTQLEWPRPSFVGLY